ncbi:MAG TPA: DUF4143 domain-containing protein [Thermoanaerobaculia bacterium]
MSTWGNLLEAAYIVRLLPPYFENFGKRVIKSPKLYFLDSALICALTRQPGGEAALAGAMGEASSSGVLPLLETRREEKRVIRPAGRGADPEEPGGGARFFRQ